MRRIDALHRLVTQTADEMSREEYYGRNEASIQRAKAAAKKERWEAEKLSPGLHVRFDGTPVFEKRRRGWPLRGV